MRKYLSIIAVLTGLFSISAVNAQSTISDSPFDLTASAGPWVALLPDYELGDASGSPAFDNDMDDLGGMVRLDAVRRALGTRTSFEADLFFAYAGASSDSGATSISVPNPADGVNAPLTGSRTSFDADTIFFGGDLIIRDTWQTRFGGLSAGIAYSVLNLDQDFDVAYDGTTLFEEELDSDFQGAKIVSGWDGYIFCRPSKLDFNVGIYDLQSAYAASAGSIAANHATELRKTTYTIETSFTTRRDVGRFDVGLILGATYFADLPVINHNVGSAATLSTDDAVTLTCMIELLLL